MVHDYIEIVKRCGLTPFPLSHHADHALRRRDGDEGLVWAPEAEAWGGGRRGSSMNGDLEYLHRAVVDGADMFVVATINIRDDDGSSEDITVSPLQVCP